VFRVHKKCVLSYWFKTESGIRNFIKKFLKEEYSGLLTPYGSILKSIKRAYC
jgi:hypothetical protein